VDVEVVVVLAVVCVVTDVLVVDEAIKQKCRKKKILQIF